MTQIDGSTAAGGEEPFQPASPDGSSKRRRRPVFQYSLRTLFLVTTLVAVLCAALFTAPVWFSGVTLVLLGVLVPMGLVVAIIYARGYFRTFCIGALFPAIPALLVSLYMIAAISFTSDFSTFFSSSDPEDFHFHIGVGVGAALGLLVLCGLFAMLVRWLVEPRRTGFVPHSPCWP
ncbi:MAG: hypothetical protein ABR915_20285 [Thermoguttaceae bacterium]|jgi:hypothetical protein